MSTLRNPVGPQPPSVYWRRRAVVGLGLLAVIVIVLLIVIRPGAEAGDAAPVETPGASDPAAEPAETDAPAEGEECLAAVLRVEPVTDANAYAGGQMPQIGFTVTNTGSVACMMNVGTTVQELRITSGSDLIWTSKDCQTDPVDFTQVLEPNVPVESPLIAWDRTRSSTSTCDAERSQVVAGGASYHLKAIVGDVESEGTVQFILN